MVQELLQYGQEHARTCRELSDLLHVKPRIITLAVRAERMNGAPICASNGDNPGYYLTDDPREIEQQCNMLKHRANEIYRTRRSLLQTLAKIRDQQQAQE